MIRMNFPPKFREVLGQLGDVLIKDINVCRTPIEKTFDTLANIISFGNWQKGKDKLFYDDMFHLFLVMKLSDDRVIRLEKNQVLNLEIVEIAVLENNKLLQKMNIPNNESLSLKIILNNTLGEIGAERMFLYDPRNANCQHFITSVLEANTLLYHSGTIGGAPSQSELVYKFINQDAALLLDMLPNFSNFLISASTSAAAIIDRIRYGAGSNSSIQSILFDRKYWTTEKARKWLLKHKLKAIAKVEFTDNFLRYRISDPEQYESFAVKKTESHLDIIIGFRKEEIETKQ